MSKGEQSRFYFSKKWKECRKAYWRKSGGLCENCLKKGLYKPAEIIHHKIHLDAVNLYNPEISLNFDNLEALCRECHAKVHDPNIKSYKIDEYGRVIVKEA